MTHAGVIDKRPEGGHGFGRLDAPVRDDRLAGAWVALGVFAVVTAVGLRAHTLWFDELQAWNIARASDSLGGLAGNLRYEGHPMLWYLPLYALTRVTGNPHAMQVLQFVIAVSTAALVLFRAPFRFRLRVALLAGYFFAFEYGVFSRSYGLGCLLLVGVLVCLGRATPRWGWATILVVALAFTSLPGAVLALGFGGTLLLDAGFRRACGPRLLISAATLAAVLVAVTCIPPDDFGNLTPGLGDSSRFGSGMGIRLGSAVTATWRALVPIPATAGEWNSNLLDRQFGAVWLEAALAVVLFVIVLVALRGRAFARRLWWIGSLGLVLFYAVVTRPEAARHAGFVFLLFLACAWFAHAPPGGARTDEAARADRDLLATLLVVVVVAQIVATIAVYPSASTEDFSRDRVLATAVERAGLQDSVVSAQDWDATTIGGYLDRDVYSLARQQEIRFLITDERQEQGIARLDARIVVCEALELANRRGAPVAVVIEGELQGYEPLVVSDDAAVYAIPPGALPADCATA